ncbi:uncharacterized protein LOC124812767 isoform X2 [Hydra vulgaris]|uniref:uncharacterized protein LOC124812767 isoform X2 n=1 Tax=Hydra vulgaris TaxID=6087 RepID=UPI0032EA73EC
MATYSKSVLDALTENPARLFNDFLRFLESTQPITVTSSASTITIPCVQPSAVESTQPITATFTCSTNVTSSAPSMTLPGVQPSAGWILQLAFCNVVGYDWAGRGAFGVAHVPSLMSTYTPLVYAVNISLRGC